MKVKIYPNGRVRCEAVIELPLSAGAAWGQLRDFESSATHDPFHAEILIEKGADPNVTRASGPCGLRDGSKVQVLQESRARAGGPCHGRVSSKLEIPRAGAQLQIVHRHLFWQTVRVGRILQWNEGRGFAYSDLCAANPSKAFPHVLSYQLQPINDKSCRLIVRVGGRWTSRVPRWMGRIWLWWVFSYVVHSVQNQLLRFALGMKLRAVIVG